MQNCFKITSSNGLFDLGIYRVTKMSGKPLERLFSAVRGQIWASLVVYKYTKALIISFQTKYIRFWYLLYSQRNFNFCKLSQKSEPFGTVIFFLVTSDISALGQQNRINFCVLRPEGLYLLAFKPCMPLLSTFHVDRDITMFVKVDQKLF